MADNLTMKVVWDMLDKITKPLKAIKAQSGGTADALKKTRDELKRLNAQQKQIGEFRELRSGLTQSAQRLQEAEDRVKGLSAEMRSIQNPTRTMTRDFDRAVRAARAIKEEHQKQGQQLQILRDRLSAAGINTEKLGTHERQLRTDIAATNAQLTAQQQKLAAVTRQQERMAAARSRLDRSRQFAGSVAGAGAGMIGAGTATGLPIVKTVRDFMTFEDSMLGVAKQVNGARDANGKLTPMYHQMGEEIKNLATQIPMSTAEIANLVTAGARMGIQGDAVGDEAKRVLLGFARDTAQMATAFEMPAEEIGDQVGKIAGIFKIPIKQLSELGDSINYLDDNSLAKGVDIINVLQGDLAGAASTLGLRASNTAALASTLLSLGESPERADTAASGMLRQLQIAKMNPERFQVGARMIGMSGSDLQMGMVKDAQGTILKVLDRINALPTESKMEAVTRLFGKDWGGAIAKLAGGVEEYRRQIDLANGAAARGSMAREFQARLAALSAQWDILGNRVFDASSSIGATLAPTLRDLFESIGNIATRLAGWIKENPALAGTLVKIAAVTAVLLAGFGALALLVGSMLLPFALLRFGLTTLGIKGGIFSVVLRGIGGAIGFVGKSLLWLGRALLMNPIGLFLTVLAGLAYLVYRNWDSVSARFTARMDEVRAAIGGGVAGITALLLNWSPLGILYTVFAGVMRWLGFDMPAKFSEFGANIIGGLVNGIKGAIGAVKSVISSVADSTVGWFKEKLGIRSPSRVFAELGDFTMQGLERGLGRSADGPLGAVQGLSRRIAQVGAGIAIGTAAMPALSFDMRPPVSAPASQPVMFDSHDQIQIVIQAAPGMDLQAISQAVSAELDRRDREKRARMRSSLIDYDN